MSGSRRIRTLIVTQDFDALLDHADKLTFVSDDEELLNDLHEKARVKYGDAATVVQSQTYYLDVTATEANKGDGITALCRRLRRAALRHRRDRRSGERHRNAGDCGTFRSRWATPLMR